LVPDKFRERKVMAAAIQLEAAAVEVRNAVRRFKFIFSNLLLRMSCLLFNITFIQLPPPLIIVTYYIYSILASNQTSCYSFIIEVLFQAIARLRCDQGDDEWSTAQRILQIHNGIYYVWWALALSRAWTISSSTFATIEDRSESDSQTSEVPSFFKIYFSINFTLKIDVGQKN
jgi:hypothetical protein